MNELLELAERCEQATGREEGEEAALLLRAYAAIFGASPESRKYESGSLGSNPDEATYRSAERFLSLIRAEAYIDAAMTLVPEGKTVRLFITPEATAAFIDDVELASVTPALALCAAALRARAATKGEGDKP